MLAAATDSVNKMRALVASDSMDLKIGQVSGLEGGDGQLTAASIKGNDGAVTRVETPPPGSPRINSSPNPWRTRPGSTTEQVACTTQPMTWRSGIAAAIRPSGSTDVSLIPSQAPPPPDRNIHHGTPFMAGMTSVRGARP